MSATSAHITSRARTTLNSHVEIRFRSCHRRLTVNLSIELIGFRKVIESKTTEDENK
ncbi:hypothetical protein D3C87_2092250 [compost metagenome]